MSYMAMFRAADVFKVGVPWSGVTNWENNTSEWMMERLGHRWLNQAAYGRTSPLTYSDGLKGQLLIIHGMADDNVHFIDTTQLIQKLVAEGKRFDLMIYPLENHVPAREDSLVDGCTRTAEYFDRHLKQK